MSGSKSKSDMIFSIYKRTYPGYTRSGRTSMAQKKGNGPPNRVNGSHPMNLPEYVLGKRTVAIPS